MFGAEEQASYLVSNYGRQCSSILSLLEEMKDNAGVMALSRAELQFCIEHEMVIKPSDFLVRRTGLLYFNRPLLDEILIPVLLEFKHRFSWTDETYEMEKIEMELLINKTNNF